ncbi:LAMI_0B06392g1_1 [Lachancea mirantina]|uniref:LAMI_0B06392g1_1 n=1 Tax=Lachancea mirantina TaxID=1230905 RepID=A0A1G4IX72_9SACH|nr:LAMI_0B06392g1_1 [Lachancea mirantina]
MAVAGKNLKKRNLNSAGQKTAKKARISVEQSEDELSGSSSASEGEDLEQALSGSDSEQDELDLSSDQDELDQSGDDESQDSVDGSDGEQEEGKKGKESGEGGQHTEQRKLLKERKMQRKSGAEVQQIKSLWERLRVKSPPMPKPVREKLCNEVWELSKDCISDLVLKHDASRVVQTLVKYSSKERREQIVEALKGKFYLLATSSYGKYLLVKLLHYGSRTSRQAIIDELHGRLRKLMRHKEGAYVVEDLYVLYATQEQRKQMIKEFWGAEYAVFKDTHKDVDIEQACAVSVEKRNIIARNLVGTITASVEKGSAGFQILHAAMKEYVTIANEKETSEFIELLEDHYAELVHTPEGAEVACTLTAKANAKQRKVIVKDLKDHTDNLIKNEYGNAVFITALNCVDDTVLMFKAFAPAAKENLAEYAVHKYARRPFLYILLGLDGKYFSPLVQKDLNRYSRMAEATSKKPALQRRHELLKRFAPVYLETISEHLSTILDENLGSQFVAEVLSSDELYEQLSKDDVQKYQEIVSQIIAFYKGDISEKAHPINTPFSARLLKSLIQGGKWDSKAREFIPLSKVEGLGQDFAQRFYDDIIDSSNLLEWINNKNSSFTVVALYEVLSKDSKSGFSKDLKKIASKITDDEQNKGARLLVKLLNSKH